VLPSTGLFQRQKKFGHNIVRRRIGPETDVALTIDREVARLLAACRQPVAIEIQRGGLEIVPPA